MFIKIITVITIILATFILAGCQLAKQNYNDSQSQSGLQNAAQGPSSAPNFPGSLNNLDLSGQADINLPGVTPPAINFSEGGTEKSEEGVRIISGRLIPVADKEGKTIVGWRIIGELYNDSEQVFDNGQIMIGIRRPENRILLAQAVQFGGFLPVAAGERMVYDTLIGNPPAGGENITVGARKVAETNPYIRIEAENLKFKRVAYNIYNGYRNYKNYIIKPVFAQEVSTSTADEGDLNSSKFTVSGTIRNSVSKPVTDLLVRYWVVSENPASKGETLRGGISEEVVAVGTWQAPQDVLSPGQTRDFEIQVTALTGADKEKLESGEIGLSAAAAGRPL